MFKRLNVSAFITLGLLCLALLAVTPAYAESLQTITANDPAVTYYGDSWTVVDEQYSKEIRGDVMMQSAYEGEYVEVTFNGTGLKYYTRIAAGAAVYDVYIDGEFKQKIDGFATSSKNNVLAYEISGLEPGEHTFKVVNTGVNSDGRKNTQIFFDAVVITSGGDASDPSDGPIVIHADHPDIVYAGGSSWKFVDEQYAEGSRGGKIMQSSYKDEYAEFVFNGTGLEFYTRFAPAAALYEVYIDDELEATVDGFESKAANNQLAFEISDLEPGLHTFKIVNTGVNSDGRKNTQMFFDTLLIYGASESDGGTDPDDGKDPGEEDDAVQVPAIDDFGVHVSFTVGGNPAADGLEPGEYVEANGIITNNYSKAVDALLVMALYNENGALIKITSASKNISPGESAEPSIGFSLPEHIEGYTVRAFVWQGENLYASSLTPLSKVFEIN